VLVRPDSYIAARFENGDVAAATRYLKEWTGGVSLVNESRVLPEEEPARSERVSGGRIASHSPDM
jgi:hypothetical protein